MFVVHANQLEATLAPALGNNCARTDFRRDDDLKIDVDMLSTRMLLFLLLSPWRASTKGTPCRPRCVRRAWRGPVEEPTTAFSFSEFQRQFGGLWRDGTLRYAVQQFFFDGGGQVVILRLASNAKLVSLDLGNGTTLLAANAGTWGNNLTALVDDNHDTGNTTDTKQFNLPLIDDATVKDDALAWGGSRVTECLLNVLVDPRSPRCLANVLKQHSTLATPQAVGAQRPPETTGSQPTAVKVNVDGNDGNELSDGDFVPTTGSARDLLLVDAPAGWKASPAPSSTLQTSRSVARACRWSAAVHPLLRLAGAFKLRTPLRRILAQRPIYMYM